MKAKRDQFTMIESMGETMIEKVLKAAGAEACKACGSILSGGICGDCILIAFEAGELEKKRALEIKRDFRRSKIKRFKSVS